MCREAGEMGIAERWGRASNDKAYLIYLASLNNYLLRAVQTGMRMERCERTREHREIFMAVGWN